MVIFNNYFTTNVGVWVIQSAAYFDRATLGEVTLFNHTHTHTHPFNGPLSRTTRVSRYQKGKTNLDFTEARDSEWQ